METSDYMVGTLKTLVKFTLPFVQHVLTRQHFKCPQHMSKNHMVIKLQNLRLMLTTIIMYLLKSSEA